MKVVDWAELEDKFMPKIKIKIHDYDIESGSLTISFVGENAKKSIDEQERLAYQPSTFPDPANPEAVFEEIARTSVYYLQQQLKDEQFKQNKSLNEKYKEYIGKEFEFDEDDLLNPPNIETYAETTVAEEILNEILIDDLKE